MIVQLLQGLHTPWVHALVMWVQTRPPLLHCLDVLGAAQHMVGSTQTGLIAIALTWTVQELMALKPWVTVTLASAPLATKEEVSYFDAWVNTVHDAHIKEWKSQPGNYHLMTKQGAVTVLGLCSAPVGYTVSPAMHVRRAPFACRAGHCHNLKL